MTETHYRERIVLAGNSAQLAGMLTEPTGRPAADRPWLVVLNAGILHKIGPNRMAVRLARDAAARGLTTLRIDYAGTGDCPARADGRPIIDGVIVDVREVLAHLVRTRGVERFVVIGLCSGADNALRVARVEERVVGVCLLDPTIHRTRRWYVERIGPRLLERALWKEVLTLRHERIRAPVQRLVRRIKREPEPIQTRPELFRTGLSDTALMEAHFRDVIARRVQLFIAFSGGWAELYNYRTQLFDAFPAVPFGDLLRLEFYPQAEHTFDMEAHRKLLLGDILDWVEGAPFGAPPRSGLERPRAGGAPLDQP